MYNNSKQKSAKEFAKVHFIKIQKEGMGKALIKIQKEGMGKALMADWEPVPEMQ